ncbi:MAG: threonine/serine dehydratase [Chloroflexi bacterium]|nr:threonine/serine dehydratase [Chloroflexota bacterium]
MIYQNACPTDLRMSHAFYTITSMNPILSQPTLAEIVRSTTLLEMARLSERLGAQVTLASETFQHTGSFKFRAAYNLARNVPHNKIITASSGNYGQALAYACQLLGKQAIVVMPQNSAQVKIDAVREYGAQVDLIDVNVVSRAARVAQLAQEHPDAYVASAYDDPLVIQGNASLGVELARVTPAFEFILAPVGGGGLSSGIISGLRASGSATPVIGAEPLLGNDAARSLRAGEIVVNAREPQTIADGARTMSIGKHNWAILRDGIHSIVEVPEEQIAQAVRWLFTYANLKAEPTGALPIGALLTQPEFFRGRRVCCVISGGNVGAGVYAKILTGVHSTI